MENKNNITEFILLGLSQEKEVEDFCFILSLVCYVAVLTGNLFTMISITCSQLINQSMYFCLSYLSLSDVYCTSTVTHKLIIDFLAEKKTISYNGCVTQFITMHFFGGIEVFILTGVAYDHYMAICQPLHYPIIMNRWRCNLMITASCDGRFLHSFGQFLLTIFLPYCGPNEIDHYLCDVYPLLKLACIDTSRIGLLIFANLGPMGLVTFVALLIFYGVILYNVRSYPVENQCKALSTCNMQLPYYCGGPFSPLFFFAPLLSIYIPTAATLPEDKVFALFYTFITPMLNPLLYTLRNTEMNKAIKKTMVPYHGLERK